MDKVPPVTRKALYVRALVMDNSGLNACKILELLKEKRFHEETEDAMLVNISKETGIELKQVTNRMTELLDGGLVSRKTEPVRFELTSSGKEFLKNPHEFLKKVEHELQMAVDLWGVRWEDAAVMRASIFMQEFFAIEEKWNKVRMPAKVGIEEVKNTAIYLRSVTPQLKDAQPKCWISRGNYEGEFSAYKVKVQEATERYLETIAMADSFSSTEERLKNLNADIEFLNEQWREKSKELTNGGWATSVIDIVGNLEMRKHYYEEFNEGELAEMIQLNQELGDYGPTLEMLAKPTHEWEPVETKALIEKAERIQTEFSESRPPVEREYVSKRKCKRCGCLTEDSA